MRQAFKGAGAASRGRHATCANFSGSWLHSALLHRQAISSGERLDENRAAAAKHYHLAVGCSVMLHALLSSAGAVRGAVFVLMAPGMAHVMCSKGQWSLVAECAR